jgi:hypothetical protein
MIIDTPQGAQAKQFELPRTASSKALPDQNPLSATAVVLSAWMERWFPDSFVFVVLAVILRRIGRNSDWGASAIYTPGLRQRILGSGPLHASSLVGCHRRLCGGELAPGQPRYQLAGGHTSIRTISGRVYRTGELHQLVVQLGVQSRLWRSAGKGDGEAP